jgi:hypothetical protein
MAAVEDHELGLGNGSLDLSADPRWDNGIVSAPYEQGGRGNRGCVAAQVVLV